MLGVYPEGRLWEERGETSNTGFQPGEGAWGSHHPFDKTGPHEDNVKIFLGIGRKRGVRYLGTGSGQRGIF